MVDWIQIKCYCCSGLQWGGDSPRECLDCDGAGMLWVSENDRIAMWPGGPFLGSEPGRFKEAAEQRRARREEELKGTT